MKFLPSGAKFSTSAGNGASAVACKLHNLAVFCGSMSIMQTFNPSMPQVPPTCMVVIVFAQPPFWLNIVTILAVIPSSLSPVKAAYRYAAIKQHHMLFFIFTQIIKIMFAKLLAEISVQHSSYCMQTFTGESDLFYWTSNVFYSSYWVSTPSAFSPVKVVQY